MAEKKQYATPLQLTTPHMHGQKVKDAQWLLKGNSKIAGLATYKDGAIDGDYGALSAQATFRAKFYLGYPTSAINRSFGQTIYEILTGNRKLDADSLRRRKSRLDATAAAQNPGSKALEHAIAQLGTKESPFGSNMQKFGSWYRMNGVPWCAIFASYCFGHTGTPNFRYSYVPFVHSDASRCRNRLCIVRSPRPGDLALFNFGARDSHIEFFEKWQSTGSTFAAVGGNTGSTNYSNGGEVRRSTRYTSNVSVFVRVT
jgi:hypothetical protein